MKRKLLYILGLLLCLSTVATSNECLRSCHRDAGKEVSAVPGDAAAGPETLPSAGEAHIVFHTFIKLLYI